MATRTHRRHAAAVLFGALAVGLAGCDSGGRGGKGKVQMSDEGLRMLLPAKVKIQPFTQVTSFDDDGIPDGLEVLIQPTDQLGDPVKVAGRFTFELWSYRAATAARKGQQLQFWEVLLDSNRDQQRYWDRTSQMYVFNLNVVPGTVPKDRAVGPTLPGKLVLVARYHTPDGQHLVDEHTLDVREDLQQMRRSMGHNAGSS